MYGSDSKKMKSKFFLAVLLLTPILVVTFSTLYFLMGMSPEGTKNNGVFFKSYFDLNNFKNGEGKQDLLKFDDGKWILSVYVTDIEASKESIYLARQLNVALNRDINKLKRVMFYSNKLLQDDLEEINLLKINSDDEISWSENKSDVAGMLAYLWLESLPAD